MDCIECGFDRKPRARVVFFRVDGDRRFWSYLRHESLLVREDRLRLVRQIGLIDEKRLNQTERLDRGLEPGLFAQLPDCSIGFALARLDAPGHRLPVASGRWIPLEQQYTLAVVDDDLNHGQEILALDHLSVKHVGEISDDARPDGVDLGGSAEEPLERGHAHALKPTRGDELVVRHVGAHVERESMRGYPAGDADSDRSELVGADPDAAVDLPSPRVDPEIRGSAD